MKNRTVIGIICMVLAVATTFLVAPLVTRLSTDTVSVPRLCENVTRGAKITEASVEMVSVKKDTLPGGVITDAKKIVGLYATTNLFSGDYLTTAKLSLNSNTADDTFSSLNGNKYAMSFTIDSFAAGLSGKLQNGDIISLVVVDKNSGKSIMWRDLSLATSEVSLTGVGWALTAASNGALASFLGVRMSAVISTPASFLKLPGALSASTGSRNAANGKTGRTPRNREILSTSIGTILNIRQSYHKRTI